VKVGFRSWPVACFPGECQVSCFGRGAGVFIQSPAGVDDRQRDQWVAHANRIPTSIRIWKPLDVRVKAAENATGRRPIGLAASRNGTRHVPHPPPRKRMCGTLQGHADDKFLKRWSRSRRGYVQRTHVYDQALRRRPNVWSNRLRREHIDPFNSNLVPFRNRNGRISDRLQASPCCLRRGRGACRGASAQRCAGGVQIASPEERQENAMKKHETSTKSVPPDRAGIVCAAGGAATSPRMGQREAAAETSQPRPWIPGPRRPGARFMKNNWRPRALLAIVPM